MFPMKCKTCDTFFTKFFCILGIHRKHKNFEELKTSKTNTKLRSLPLLNRPLYEFLI